MWLVVSVWVYNATIILLQCWDLLRWPQMIFEPRAAWLGIMSSCRDFQFGVGRSSHLSCCHEGWNMATIWHPFQLFIMDFMSSKLILTSPWIYWWMPLAVKWITIPSFDSHSPGMGAKLLNFFFKIWIYFCSKNRLTYLDCQCVSPRHRGWHQFAKIEARDEAVQVFVID